MDSLTEMGGIDKSSYIVLEYISLMTESIVAKFGGTSMAQPEAVARVVEAHPEHKAIIVSAPGTDPSTGLKMTDSLLTYGLWDEQHSAQALELRDEIVDRFDTLYSMLDNQVRSEMRTVCASMLESGNTNPHFYTALGERISARYFASLIGAHSLRPAIYFNKNGELNPGKTKAQIRTQISKTQGGRVVIPGFYGYNPDHEVRLLGRGGSDRTGALYAGALGLDYENWTDVSGIYSADPRIVDSAHIIPELTRDEVREGAHGGSGVLQGNAILDLSGSGVTTIVKNTNDPEAPGTRITHSLDKARERAVVAVSGREDLVKIAIHDLGMAEKQGYVAELLTKLALHGLSFEHMPAAQDSFGITLHAESDNLGVQEFVNFASNHRLSQQASITNEECGAVYVVGEGLRDQMQLQRVTARVLSMAAGLDISVLPVVGTRSPSLALLTNREQVVPLVRAIHKYEVES